METIQGQIFAITKWDLYADTGFYSGPTSYDILLIKYYKLQQDCLVPCVDDGFPSNRPGYYSR